MYQLLAVVSPELVGEGGIRKGLSLSLDCFKILCSDPITHTRTHSPPPPKKQLVKIFLVKDCFSPHSPNPPPFIHTQIILKVLKELGPQIASRGPHRCNSLHPQPADTWGGVQNLHWINFNSHWTGSKTLDCWGCSCRIS